MDALDIIRKHADDADADFLREMLQVVLQVVMHADVSRQIGADLHEHAPDRSAYRNGYRRPPLGHPRRPAPLTFSKP
jgi:transposase-like protein